LSIASVQARIAQIQSAVGVRATQPSGGAAFGTSLAAATQEATSAPASPAAGATPLADVTSAALSRPAVLRAPAQVHHHGKLEPPAELRAYGNGKIPANALSTLGEGEHRMWAPAAASFKQLRAAAAADGVKIGVTDSYRSYDQQVDLAKRKGLYSQGGLAATPGTSNHGWGMSLDLDLDSKALGWMRANGEKYGFVEDVPREPWHWTFHGAA